MFLDNSTTCIGTTLIQKTAHPLIKLIWKRSREISIHLTYYIFLFCLIGQVLMETNRKRDEQFICPINTNKPVIYYRIREPVLMIFPGQKFLPIRRCFHLHLRINLFAIVTKSDAVLRISGLMELGAQDLIQSGGWKLFLLSSI